MEQDGEKAGKKTNKTISYYEYEMIMVTTKGRLVRSESEVSDDNCTGESGKLMLN